NISVADKSIPFIDPLKELVTAVEPREERFAKTQREPADSKPETAAEKAHKSRTVNRGTIKRTGAPAPPAAKIVPSAIVERSKSPRCIVNPSPPPRAYPVPIAIAVGSPVRRDVVGIPDMAILRLVLPRTGIVEVAITIMSRDTYFAETELSSF